MDAELALAIALSLEEERQRKSQEEAAGASWQWLHELRCCGTSFFSLTPLPKCPSCGRTVEQSSSSPTATAAQSNQTGSEAKVQESSDAPRATVHKPEIGPAKGRCLAIRPTVGSFRRYNNKMLLHCGLTDTSGNVYNFDEGGLHIESDWNECISIPIHAPHVSDEAWNAELDRHHKAELTFKSFRPYRQLQNNCYDYVIRFLNGLKFEGRDNHEKEDIVKRFIQTPVDLFESYFAVLTKLNSREGQRQGFVKLDSVASPRHICDACSKPIPADGTRYRCTVCQDFDLCVSCKDKELAAHKRSHMMIAIDERARYTCDGCRNPIAGARYHCLECPDFDLCSECQTRVGSSGGHSAQHRLVKL